MATSWTKAAADYLLATTSCPRCGAVLTSTTCGVCHADLGGDVGADVWAASQTAAEALRTRQRLIDRLPTVSVAVPASVGRQDEEVDATTAPSPAQPGTGASPAAPLAGPPSGAPTASSTSQVSVQSVLAVAGAGLFAVAAIVFTFLNPDLTDFTTRRLIIGVVTLLFLAGAWLLGRMRLQFSAEAIGGLGLVFLGLDVWGVSSSLEPGVDPLVSLGIGTFVAALAMLALGVLTRMRTWLWGGLVGAAVAPIFFGLAAGSSLGRAFGFLGVAVAALVAHEFVRRLRGRFGSSLVADRVTLTVVEILGGLAVVPGLIGLDVGSLSAAVLVAVGFGLALATIAVLSARHGITAFWSFSAGMLAAISTGLLPFALQLPVDDFVWYLALTPVGVGLAVVAIVLVRRWGAVSRPLMLVGAWTVSLVASSPAIWTALGQLIALARQGAGRDSFAESTGPALVGLVAAAASWWVLVAIDRGGTDTIAERRLARVIGLAHASLALLALVAWSVLGDFWQAAVGLVGAVAVAALLVRVPAIHRFGRGLRTIAAVTAHLALVEVAAIVWDAEALRIGGGVAVIGTIAALALIVAPKWRFLHVGVGYAYALVVLAEGLRLAGVIPVATLAITTSAAALVALVVSLTRWTPVRSWYAILTVTAVPFVIGVGLVIAERSGWTALSTGLMFCLAAALVITQRPGLTRLVRATSATLLVPSLAVVVVSLTAQFLAISGSIVALPVVAVIVAAALASTSLVQSALARRSETSVDAAAVRIAIESSSLLTALIAVTLALVRPAAGLDITLVVLLILGVGFAAVARFAGRLYGWALAAASFTGAMWCVWGLVGVTVVEPYVLPPALGAALVGLVLVVRGEQRAVGLFAVGLTAAAVPTIVLLGVEGSGPLALGPWRTVGLVAASIGLVGFGALATRAERLAPLRHAALMVAILAASGAAIHGMRLGLGAETGVPGVHLMVQAVVCSAVAASIAVIAGWMLRSWRPSQWLLAAAFVYAVVAPMTAIRPDAGSILTLWALELLLLAVMVLAVVRARSEPTVLPPVWFIFAVALVTSIVGWSQREVFRLEGFSLPLGAALIAVGVLAMRPARREIPASPDSWPLGFTGSWRVLAPGILVALGPSVVATGTDPATWRAILVIAMALVAILLGSRLRLGAPFILGLVVLPIENVVVFAVQLGNDIQAAPWWITLATAGAVLLAIAVGYERRASGDSGIAARLRDLT